MSGRDRSIRDRIAQNDVTVARSYLEVDFMEWFSENEIPFGYEPFTIPSTVGPSKEQWDRTVDAIKAVGNREFSKYDRLSQGTALEDRRPAEVLAEWEDIYDKHGLQNEQVVVEVRRSLSQYSKRLLLPDFALYFDANTTLAGENFDWSDWDKIVEVSGLWGVGLPGEAGEGDWWNWYRVAAVAYKELAYKLLGLWDDVVWVVPNQPFIEGVSDGIPNALRDDPNYVIFNTTSASPELGGLYTALGLSEKDLTEFESRLSPAIDLINYDRDLDNSTIRAVEWEYDGIDLSVVDEVGDAVIVDEEWIVFHGELGELYISPDSVHVRGVQWENQNMILIREYVMDSISLLNNAGVVTGLKPISGREV